MFAKLDRCEVDVTAPVMQRYQRYWLDFAVSRVKLAWLRVGLFTLVGLDALLQIEHAPRYGAGDFNVANLPWLDSLLPEPSRPIMLVLFLWQGYLGFCIALGGGRRVALWLLTALYGYSYFISQLDSYQHHYFVFLIILVSCFVPWWTDQSEGENGTNGTTGARRESSVHDTGRVASWALRLITVQMAVLYFWAAVAKMEPAWLDGTTLGKQLPPGWLRDMAEWLGMSAGAKLVLATELFLAVAMVIRSLWLPALILGVGLHASIEIAEFDIGRFSYFMFVLYLLLVPERMVAAGHRALARGRAGMGRAMAPLVRETTRAWLVTAAALAAGSALLWALPFREITIVIIGIMMLAGASIAWSAWKQKSDPRQRSSHIVAVALAHLVACAVMVTLIQNTDQAHNYYKYWGGTSRRLSNWPEAKEAYEKLTRLSPDYASGHFHLANIARREGRMDDALAGYQRAQRANPDDYRGFLQEAVIHHHAGRGAKALAAVSRALKLGPRGPSDLELAREIYDHWSR